MPSLSDWLMITELLSGAAQGRNQAQGQNEALGITAANDANNAALNYDKFNLAAPGERLRQSRIADIGSRSAPITAEAGTDPASGKSVVHWGGGPNTPNLYSPNTNQLADEVSHQHLMDQLAGPKKPTAMPSVGGSSVADKALSAGSAAGTGMSILKLLGLFGGGKSGPNDPGNVRGGEGYFDGEGNWVSSWNPGGAIPGYSGTIPEDPRHD